MPHSHQVQLNSVLGTLSDLTTATTEARDTLIDAMITSHEHAAQVIREAAAEVARLETENKRLRALVRSMGGDPR